MFAKVFRMQQIGVIVGSTKPLLQNKHRMPNIAKRGSIGMRHWEFQPHDHGHHRRRFSKAGVVGRWPVSSAAIRSCATARRSAVCRRSVCSSLSRRRRSAIVSSRRRWASIISAMRASSSSVRSVRSLLRGAPSPVPRTGPFETGGKTLWSSISSISQVPVMSSRTAEIRPDLTARSSVVLPLPHARAACDNV